MNFDYCRDCERESLCQYPCSEFTTESEKFNKLNDNILNEKLRNKEEMEENESSKPHETEISYQCNNDTAKTELENVFMKIYEKTKKHVLNENSYGCEMDCLENFLQYTVEDSEFLDVLNDDMDIMNMIDMSALLSYMSKINETYCEANNLCTQCHSKLIEVKEPRGEYFGEPASERIIVCPHCG